MSMASVHFEFVFISSSFISAEFLQCTRHWISMKVPSTKRSYEESCLIRYTAHLHRKAGHFLMIFPLHNDKPAPQRVESEDTP